MSNDLILALPFSSLDETELISVRSVVYGFDTSLGISYAKTWGTSRNTNQYYSFNSDCTNFTSQILENGGVSQIVTSSEYTGWWHLTGLDGIGYPYHYHSRSWTIADVFARYMGVGATATTNYYFSTIIQAGDFVAADWTGDGNWDHMGFVVATSSTYTSGHYPYKIAQHSTDYIAWSTSSTNNWDVSVGKYGRVRR